MSVNVRLKHSKVVGRVPTSGDLVDGELALSLADEKVYMKNAAGDVVQVAGTGTPANDGRYVVKAPDSPATQDLSGNLTLGTDKITLDAATGTADFDGDVQIGGGYGVGGGCNLFVNNANTDDERGALVVQGRSTMSATALEGTAFAVSDSLRNVALLDYQGSLSLDKAGAGADNFFLHCRSDIGTSPNNLVDKVLIKADGSAEVAGTVTVNDIDVSSNLTSGCEVRSDGLVRAQRPTGSSGSAVFQAWNGNLNSASILANGSAEFKGDVAIGDSATFLGNLGDAIAQLPPNITEQFANIISSLPVAQPFTGDPTTLPADIPTPLKDALVRVTTAGKINLNSDGSSTFAGGVESRQGILADQRIIAGNTLDVAGTSVGFSVGATNGCLVYTDGSATFSNAITLGDGITGGNGAYLYPGSLSIRGDTINNESSAFVVYRGGSASSNITAQITQSGSASFASDIQSGNDPNNGIEIGCKLYGSQGTVGACANTGVNVWSGQSKGTTAPTSTISADGSAEFAGGISSGVSTSTGYLQCKGDGGTYGYIFAENSSGLGNVSLNYKDGSSLLAFVAKDAGDNLISSIGWDGSATFADGEFTVSSAGFGDFKDAVYGGTKASPTNGGFSQYIGVAGFARANTDSNQSAVLGQNFLDGGRVWCGVNSAGTVTSEILTDGSSTVYNLTFNLEPDDDANYTTTTEEYTETIQVPVENGVANADLVNGAPEQQYTEQTVTKTREIKTYTGPTMNVKDSVLDLQLRLDTRDAQLEQALIRIQELESADSSALEARIAALEVDMNRFKAI